MQVKKMVTVFVLFCLLGSLALAESLTDGTYEGFCTQPTYLIRATLTVENGQASDVIYEECHQPNYWATFTAEEASNLADTEYIVVPGSRGDSYYAKNAIVGTGEEAIVLTASYSEGEARPVYGNSDINDFTVWLTDDPVHDAWYYAQLEAGDYWVALNDGTKCEDLSVYTTTLKDGTLIEKNQSRFKTKVRHWTAVGTGVGTESGERGWQGNVNILADFLVENQFPEGDYNKNEENVVVIGDAVTGATIESYPDYLTAAYNAYAQALSK